MNKKKKKRNNKMKIINSINKLMLIDVKNSTISHHQKNK